MTNSPAVFTRLEKAGYDNGFDILLPFDGEWLPFASSRCPLKIWLASNGELLLVAFSDVSVLSQLNALVVPISNVVPKEARSVISVANFPDLYFLLKRAFQLSRALPSEPLREFQNQTKDLPKSTEVERIIIQRVGQDIFRERLFEFWDGKCAATGLAIPGLLRASHIKPWKDCATDAERLDVFNGLLLAPHFDAAFDRGYISFGDDGHLIVSQHLGPNALKTLGIDPLAKLNGLSAAHFKYLSWHRTNELKGV